MEQTLSKFIDVYENPYQTAKSWKAATKKKVIGCLPMYAPEEIIHAAGMLPVIMFEDEEPVTLGDKYLQTNACEMMRSTYDMILRGKFDFLDGMVIQEICDQPRFFGEVLESSEVFPYIEHLWPVYRLDKTTRPFIVEELNRFRSTLGEFSGKEISDEAIWKSIKVYNENRALLRKLYGLRRKNPGLIKAADMVKVVVSGMVMPKEEHSKLLAELVSKAEAKTLVADGKIKVALTGQLCSLPDKPLLDMIEELGMVVVDDDLYAGGRYFATDVKTDGHPIEALADYQLNIPPCPTRQKPEYYSVTNPAPYYSEYVVDMINRSSAQGVIVLKVMYCDPYDVEYPVLSEKLSDKGIPNFTVITGYEMASLESIRTRLQAFIEMISQK